ncbi:MAG: NfeD family protein [Fusobacteriota bacterium]
MGITEVLFILGIILIILEMFTPSSFIFFGIGVGTLITGIISLWIEDITMLIIIDIILSMGIFFFMRKKEIFNPNTEYKSNNKTYIGKEVEVIKKLDDGNYRVKIFGEEWMGICKKDLEKGDKVKVSEIDGNKMILI